MCYFLEYFTHQKSGAAVKVATFFGAYASTFGFTLLCFDLSAFKPIAFKQGDDWSRGLWEYLSCSTCKGVRQSSVMMMERQ